MSYWYFPETGPNCLPQVIALVGSYGGHEVWGDTKGTVLAELGIINFVRIWGVWAATLCFVCLFVCLVGWFVCLCVCVCARACACACVCGVVEVFVCMFRMPACLPGLALCSSCLHCLVFAFAFTSAVAAAVASAVTFAVAVALPCLALPCSNQTHFDCRMSSFHILTVCLAGDGKTYGS